MSANSSISPAQAVTWKLDVPTTQPTIEHIAKASVAGQAKGIEVQPVESSPVDPTDHQDGGKYRSIVKIQSRFDDKKSGDSTWMMGTGWLVGADLLVTSGHTVYDWKSGLGPASQINCFIGYNGSGSSKTSDVQARYGSNVVTTREWMDSSSDRSRDVAFIQIDRPFQGNLRPFPFRDTPSLSSSKIHLGVVGYPGDTADGADAGAQMYEHFNKINYDLRDQTRNMLQYKISTYGGQSGSPILQRDQDGLVVLGTHSYGGPPNHDHLKSAIQQTWSNDYEPFISLFQKDGSAIPASANVELLDGA